MAKKFQKEPKLPVRLNLAINVAVNVAILARNNSAIFRNKARYDNKHWKKMAKKLQKVQ